MYVCVWCVCICVCRFKYIMLASCNHAKSICSSLYRTLNTEGDIHTIFVTCFDSINTAGRSYQNQFSVTVRVFVCVLYALALCQGNHFTTMFPLQFLNQCKNSKGVYAFSGDTTTRTINVHLTKQIYGHETCGRNTLTHSSIFFRIFWQLKEILLWKKIARLFLVGLR